MSSVGMTPRSGPKIYAVDLFCGAGGLTHGLMKAGVDVRLGVDIDPHCEYPFSANNGCSFILKSVRDLKARDLTGYYRRNGIRLLAGCAPCQTFSTYNQKASRLDERWWLLLQFGRLVGKVGPELVTMENVPGLQDQDVFEKFVRKLKRLGYFVSHRIVSCADYGVPQRRDRLVLLASRLGPVELLSPKQFGRKAMNVIDAIGRLPRIQAGEAHPEDPIHMSASLSKINMRRIRSSKPGKSWRDWPAGLVADCHKRSTGRTYPSVYGRMEWSAPAPTMTTLFFGFGNGRFGHPEQDRAISLREGAILQSFPRKYKFVPPDQKICQRVIGRLIGNAVPVTLGEVIGKSLLNHVAKAKLSRKKA